MPERIKVTKESSITLIEPPATSGGRLDTGLVGDVYSAFHLPSRAIDGLKATAGQKGYKNVTCINPRYNRIPGKFDDQDWRVMGGSDVLGISTITRTIPQARQIAQKYKEFHPEGLVVAGGPHVTFMVEESLGWADIVVRGEGDEAFPELLEALEDNGSSKGVKGTSYKEGDAIVNEPDRAFLTEEQLGQLPWPDFDPRFRTAKGKSISVVITSRGCPYRCGFCSVSAFNGETFRRMGNEFILARLEQLHRQNPRERVFFGDDNFAGKPRQAEALLEGMIERRLSSGLYMAQLRGDIGLRKGFPDFLRRAGVTFVAVGIESINQNNLTSVDKGTSVKNTLEGVRALREAGVKVHGMFIMPLDDDTEESLMDQIELAKAHVDTAQFCAPIPLPGTPFAKEMEEQGRILTKEYQYYGGQDVVLRPKNMSPERAQELIYYGYEQFYTPKKKLELVKAALGAVVHWVTHLSRERWDGLVLDTVMRYYANNTLKSVRNDPQTLQHHEELKEQSEKAA